MIPRRVNPKAHTLGMSRALLRVGLTPASQRGLDCDSCAPPSWTERPFDAAQVQMQRNAHNRRRNRKYEYLLCNARLRCGRCRAVMGRHTHTGSGPLYYRGNRRRFQAVQPCRGSARANTLAMSVWAAVDNVLHYGVGNNGRQDAAVGS
jgi:hypothetical protein